MLAKLTLSADLEDKIFEIRYSDDDSVSKIISYFPFSESEKHKILSIMNVDSFDAFHSIFKDVVTDDEWNQTKKQIKKKFRDELFDIDDVS